MWCVWKVCYIVTHWASSHFSKQEFILHSFIPPNTGDSRLPCPRNPGEAWLGRPSPKKWLLFVTVFVISTFIMLVPIRNRFLVWGTQTRAFLFALCHFILQTKLWERDQWGSKREETGPATHIGNDGNWRCAQDSDSIDKFGTISFIDFT